jgi:anti-sigma B factor antagonist
MAERRLDIAVAPGSRPGHQIATLKGELTLETVKQFQDALRAESAPVLILDMHNVNFLDSSGVGALVNLYVGRERTQRCLGIADPGARVRAALEVAGIHRVLSIFVTIAAAEQQLA